MIVKGIIAALPVIACLVAFEWIDAFKLLGLRDVIGLMVVGALVAAGAFYANGGVLDRFPISEDAYTSYVAPLAEEALKCACVVVLFAFNRIGYLIDAAIAGFAIGSGFALAENLFFLHQFTDANIGVWVVRGFGTAIMHGGATALFAVLSMALYAPRLRVSAERFHFNPLLFVPGFAAAVVMHGVFNHFQHAPLLAMAVVLLAVPLSLFAIFSAGETHAHRWLVEDRATHARLLEDMRSGAFAGSAGGRAVEALAARMGRHGAADLFDYVRTNTELVVRADETLLAIEAHDKVALDVVVRGKLEHLHNLERRLGHATVLAVRQHLHVSRDDLWKLHQLEADTTRKGLRAQGGASTR
jgi:RsiW-degrading membrane proteinase PrsW (M82 family)